MPSSSTILPSGCTLITPPQRSSEGAACLPRLTQRQGKPRAGRPGCQAPGPPHRPQVAAAGAEQRGSHADGLSWGPAGPAPERGAENHPRLRLCPRQHPTRVTPPHFRGQRGPGGGGRRTPAAEATTTTGPWAQAGVDGSRSSAPPAWVCRGGGRTPQPGQHRCGLGWAHARSWAWGGGPGAPGGRSPPCGHSSPACLCTHLGPCRGASHPAQGGLAAPGPGPGSRGPHARGGGHSCTDSLTQLSAAHKAVGARQGPAAGRGAAPAQRSPPSRCSSREGRVGQPVPSWGLGSAQRQPWHGEAGRSGDP